MSFALPSYFDHNFQQCPRRVDAVRNKLIFSLPLFKGREKLSLLSLLSFIEISRGEYEEGISVINRCKLQSSPTLLVLSTEVELFSRTGETKATKQTLKQLKRLFADTYAEFLQVEALIDLALAHIVFGLNCAALEILHKAKSQLSLSSKRSNRTICFLTFCYGLVYYYFNQNSERGLSKHYAQLCVDKLTPLLKLPDYRNVCGVYLWKLQVRMAAVTVPVPGCMLGSGYAQYQIGKECVKVGLLKKGVDLLKRAVEGGKMPDVYYWLGQGMERQAIRQKGFDPVWQDIKGRCPVYDKPPVNEQETGVSPPPPTAVALYRRDRERRLALTSPTAILKIIQKIDHDRKSSNEILYVEALECYRKAIIQSPIVVDEYNLALAKLMIYLNQVMNAEALLIDIIGRTLSPFTLFEASLLLATCFASGKILVASEHIQRCLDLLPKITVNREKLELLTEWCVYYAHYHCNRKNSVDCRYWVDHLEDLEYPQIGDLNEKLKGMHTDEKVARMVSNKWLGKATAGR